MVQGQQDVRWLSTTEMTAWRSYIVSTMRLRQRLHRELAEQHDVSLIDYEVLVALSGVPEHRMRMTELATMLGSTKSRLSHQVARMEDVGHVRRGKDSDDRRGVTAELTDEGLALLQAAAPTHVGGVREHLIDRMDPDEQVTIGAVFSRVLTHLTSLDD